MCPLRTFDKLARWEHPILGSHHMAFSKVLYIEVCKQHDKQCLKRQIKKDVQCMAVPESADKFPIEQSKYHLTCQGNMHRQT